MIEMKRWLGGALAAGFALAGCGDDGDDPAPREEEDAAVEHDAATEHPSEVAQFVGEVEGSDVRLAVVRGSSKLRVFFCGGDESYESGTRWINLDLEGDELKYDEDGWRVNAQLSEREISGTVERPDDEERVFSAAPVEAGTAAGLFEGKADCGRVGLIVSPGVRGSEPRTQGVCLGEGAPEQVNPIAPVEAEDGKIRVLTPGGGPEETLLLQQATLTPL